MSAGTVLNFDLDAYVSPRRALIEQRLEQYLPNDEPALLWESMRYSVLSGGKRFRALLCLSAAEAVAGPGEAAETALPCACALEMIHAMSLIHDDLPCMDNDDYRRGKPTNHKVFGEAMALLAGDALLVLAGEILLRHTAATVDREVLIDVAAELARATGPQGMVGGQVADSIATGLVRVGEQRDTGENVGKASEYMSSATNGNPMLAATEQLLESIHKRKTGALLRFSVWSGARLAGANDKVLSHFAEFGETLGLAFQIADDLLDTTGDLQTLGKTPGKDEAAGKLTWISVFGKEGALSALSDLRQRGLQALHKTGLPDSSLAPLAALLDYAIERKH